MHSSEVNQIETGSKIGLAINLGLISIGFLGLDVLLPQNFGSGGWFSFILLNAAVAQLTLLCVWGTLVEGTFWVRLPWTILLLVVGLTRNDPLKFLMSPQRAQREGDVLWGRFEQQVTDQFF